MTDVDAAFDEVRGEGGDPVVPAFAVPHLDGEVLALGVAERLEAGLEGPDPVRALRERGREHSDADHTPRLLSAG